MGASKIEWTDDTWNPVAGCTKIAVGCKNCYAERMAARLAKMALADKRRGRNPGGKAKYDEELRLDNTWNERVVCDATALGAPLGWRKPRTVFVCSMSDLFHPGVPFEFIDRVFAVMALTPQHHHLVLTKRPERAVEYMHQRDWSDAANYITDRFVRRLDGAAYLAGEIVPPLPNVGFGVSISTQADADRDLPVLAQIPAAMRFISAEPLVARIERLYLRGIDWLIAGGESGPGARPMHPDSARSLRDQCVAGGVAFFFKGWGKWLPGSQATHLTDEQLSRFKMTPVDSDSVRAYSFRVPKKLAGRLLDGRTWNEMPAGWGVGSTPCTVD